MERLRTCISNPKVVPMQPKHLEQPFSYDGSSFHTVHSPKHFGNKTSDWVGLSNYAIGASANAGTISLRPKTQAPTLNGIRKLDRRNLVSLAHGTARPKICMVTRLQQLLVDSGAILISIRGAHSPHGHLSPITPRHFARAPPHPVLKQALGETPCLATRRQTPRVRLDTWVPAPIRPRTPRQRARLHVKGQDHPEQPRRVGDNLVYGGHVLCRSCTSHDHAVRRGCLVHGVRHRLGVGRRRPGVDDGHAVNGGENLTGCDLHSLQYRCDCRRIRAVGGVDHRGCCGGRRPG
ncbi:hypothetical protein B0H63DRAFT_65901 [Podospora didyma]|uniref:Uncharacterized protein n=1 Tax=Podospora didyma TaxID=330526 RepID=A0AAE0P8H9_9PEZI|nr:hypothetical protein B0H63DRAFT_65901 [Podospora didyma]